MVIYCFYLTQKETVLNSMEKCKEIVRWRPVYSTPTDAFREIQDRWLLSRKPFSPTRNWSENFIFGYSEKKWVNQRPIYNSQQSNIEYIDTTNKKTSIYKCSGSCKSTKYTWDEALQKKLSIGMSVTYMKRKHSCFCLISIFHSGSY